MMNQCNSKSERNAHHILSVVVFAICFGVGSVAGMGQKPTISTGSVRTAPPVSQPVRSDARSRGRILRAARTVKSTAPRSSSAEESDKFVNLGDQFAEKSKWHAAEAAYNEAIKLYSGNSNAFAAMGYMYVDQGNLGEAYRVLNRLRAINSGMAEDLLVEIKRK
jgi:tetratricopeptide (TPR) repeat protein